MCDYDGEKEIIIEYSESFDGDPLSENSEKQTCKNALPDDYISSNYPDENINKEESDESSANNQQASTINNKNCNFVIPENKELWYKIDDEFGRYQCKYCDRYYSVIKSIREHTKNKHFEEYKCRNTTRNKNRISKFKCHVCKKIFKSPNVLQEHIIQAHGIENIQKSCSICHAMFDDYEEMLMHMSNSHASQKKLHLCVKCGYSTSKLSHFKQHENTHTRNDQKKCPHCEYTTNHEPNLKVHERIHTNIKPYSCNFSGCDYRCAAKSAWYSHQLKHEKENNMIYCDKCSYSTVYKQSLKKHLDSHERNSVRTKF